MGVRAGSLSHTSRLRAAWLGRAGLVLLASGGGLAACGSDAGSVGSDGGTPKPIDTADLCVNLPSGACAPPPSRPKPSGGEPPQASHNYAVRALYLGDMDRTGAANEGAWKTIGYDLDGRITRADSNDVCTPVPGSSRQVQVDGDRGIDNSFGANVLPLLEYFDTTVTTQALDQSILGGSFTDFIFVTGFDDSPGNATTNDGLTGALLPGAKYAADGGAPTWNASTTWPILPDPGLISGCSPYPTGCPAGLDPVANARVQFESAFQIAGTYSTGTPAPVTLILPIFGSDLRLNIASAVITFDPRARGSITNGTVAGVIEAQTLVDAMRAVAGEVSTNALCTASAFDSIATQIEQSSDIVIDGGTGAVSNAPGTTCNAISIGLGFDATEIAPPTTIAHPTPPEPNRCDAGAD